MNKELLSITDENSILITVEFLEDGNILKVGDRETQRFEIDLIVNDNITLNQLLEAVQSGLKKRLWDQFHFDVCTDSTIFLYTDSRHPEAETTNIVSEGKINQVLSRPFKFSFLERRRIKKALKEQKELEDRLAVEGISEKDSTEFAENDVRDEEEKDRDAYIICWNVFQECYDYYNEDFKKHEKITELERIKYGSPREPVIGLGSANYNKIPYGSLLHESDIFKICLRKELGSTPIKQLGFMTSSRLIFDPIGWHHSAALFDITQVNDAFKEQVPLYNISERPLRKLDDESLKIIPPTEIPKKNSQNLIVTILTPLLMTVTMVAIRVFTVSNSGTSLGSMGWMTGCMSIVTVITALVNSRIRKKEHKEQVKEWRNQYQTYIQRVLADIKKKQDDDIEKLHVLFPPARSNGKNNLVAKALSIDGDIFSRGQEHPDFLSVRIGISTDDSELVPSVFDIIGEKREAVFASAKYQNILNISAQYPFSIILPEDKNTGNDDGSAGYLINLPSDIARTYGYLKNAPVRINLIECETLGIVVDKRNDLNLFLSNFLLDLCFYQSPDDLQIVLFCPESHEWKVQQDVIRRYKHLPHFRELLGDLSAFAFNKDDAYLIFNKLLEILSERKEGKAGTKFSHILVVIQDEYEIKRHPVSEYLPSFSGEKENPSYGISFIFCKRYVEELPKYCGNIIKKESTPDGENWYLLPHKQLITRSSSVDTLSNIARYGFQPDEFPPEEKDIGNQDDNDRYYRAFKTISALYYERIAQGADVPSSIDLIDLLEGDREEKFDPGKSITDQIKEYVLNSWGVGFSREKLEITTTRDISKTLAVPIGMKGSGLVELDLHEKSDGPHMLVAGTTGSGKTETVLTFLINLCTYYTPEQVNLLLMDMKGAGFVQRIGQDDNKLPHVVGTVTDISGDETGTGTAYMLKRFLHSMSAEVKRRKLYLNKMDVDNVDAYGKARLKLDEHISTHSKLKGKKDELLKLPSLPHLFLVIDEFTELMQFSSENGDVDFKAAITSLARIGRSLGFHIILISQNIENAITPDIRVNSRARLCLKVATRDASKEMIGTDLAASPLMPGNGRAYLLVGTGSRFEYFQSGYSGADISRKMDTPIIITCAERTGEYTLFFNSEDSNSNVGKFNQKGLELADSEDDLNACVEALDNEKGEISLLEKSKMEETNCENTKMTLSDSFTNEINEQELPYTREPDKALSDTELASEKVKTGITQLKTLVDQIKACDELCRKNGLWEEPHCVFQQPLPTACFYDYNWATGTGICKNMDHLADREQEEVV